MNYCPVRLGRARMCAALRAVFMDTEPGVSLDLRCRLKQENEGFHGKLSDIGRVRGDED